MTPDHQQLIDTTLRFAYSRSVEMNTALAIPQGKEPPAYTTDMMWNSPLGRDLTSIANYVEGYPAQEGTSIISILHRVLRVLFGYTLTQKGYRLPSRFHKTSLGEMIFAAFARCYPPDTWMRTSEVVKLYGVKRQTIYDWAEEGKLSAYYIKGVQMFHRKQIEKHHAQWLEQKQGKDDA